MCCTSLIYSPALSISSKVRTCSTYQLGWIRIEEVLFRVLKHPAFLFNMPIKQKKYNVGSVLILKLKKISQRLLGNALGSKQCCQLFAELFGQSRKKKKYCTSWKFCDLTSVVRIRICRIHMSLGLKDPDLDPLVRCTDPDPDPSIIKQK
jgi:hypothetical protein